MDDELNLREYINVILKRWKLIVFITLAIMMIGLLLTLSEEKIYDSKITILIKSGSNAGFSGYGGVIGLAGFQLPTGGGSLGDLIEVLKSRAVAAKVVEDLNLRERIKGWDNPSIPDDDLASAVQGMLKKPRPWANLVELRVEYTDPKLAADIANAYADALSIYWNKINFTEARKKREYIETQLPRIERALKNAEKRLKQFTLLAPKSSSPQGVVSGSQLQGIEVARLSRELEIQNSVYTMLRKEYESVKLEESKEIPPFSIVDQALVPKRPSKPKVKLRAIMSLIFGLFAGTFTAFFREYWEKSGIK